ncbi:uncharacterized protein Z519_08954 [Cladophialophora bantiana CBS 173.52]|uniref:Flavoprotein domain-containing protein n=1 Tax=Cladophialophora bantiana (strain ATCC 10958 / CBS 173.52 / CDC B-1940 / NIH 8579) TaxID=1442370 RepID=A0A0D2HHP4_CLAB1|nr:uncharacterized protein Z519_08954 [Cladophialophora bantiana CBS 173.52]KIW90310.1 hypothetical protein Z519_08954 [Cladophialophora bantiana CBS 173.52]
MTGATCAILGIKTLIASHQLNVETQLINSQWGQKTIKYETDYDAADVRALADHIYSIHGQASLLASGPFRADGMAILSCRMKTLAGISAGYCDDMKARVADLTLKEP